jgi:eukaryotic-like serine/threonine-protein kinase
MFGFLWHATATCGMIPWFPHEHMPDDDTMTRLPTAPERLHRPATLPAFDPAAIPETKLVEIHAQETDHTGSAFVYQSFGRFTLLRIIGSGGMGIVYEAYDPQLERNVALKVMRDGLPSEAMAAHRFLSEARSLASIQHPRIVAIHDIGCEQDSLYLSMELLKGENLETFIDRGTRMSVAELIHFAAQATEALIQIHDQGLVHRDIKPANFWLCGSTRDVKLLDFGLAMRLEANLNLTRSSLILGTPMYMSPEHARGDGATPKSDLFALGIIFYELATGQRPFHGTTALQILFNVNEMSTRRYRIGCRT